MHLSSFIPRMSRFTLAIYYLTTSNLPWFMDLPSQVPIQYCSLQHRTLLLSPVISTSGCSFCFGSNPSFFLKLFLHWSLVVCWAPINLRNSSFSTLSFCLFILFFAAKDGEALYSQQKQDQELTVAQIMNSILPNSDLNWRKWGKPLDYSGMS